MPLEINTFGQSCVNEVQYWFWQKNEENEHLDNYKITNPSQRLGIGSLCGLRTAWASPSAGSVGSAINRVWEAAVRSAPDKSAKNAVNWQNSHGSVSTLPERGSNSGYQARYQLLPAWSRAAPHRPDVPAQTLQKRGAGTVHRLRRCVCPHNAVTPSPHNVTQCIQCHDGMTF